MKSSTPNPMPSCCVIVKQRACYEHGDGCKEPDYAMGWVLQLDKYDSNAQERLLDTLEDLGFTKRLDKKV